MQLVGCRAASHFLRPTELKEMHHDDAHHKSSEFCLRCPCLYATDHAE